MKIGFVTPRYGTEIVGGAEYAARMLAERLRQAGDEVTVFTTCASGSRTWANELPAGESIVNGVRVCRFSNLQREKHFEKLSSRLREDPNPSAEMQWNWFRAQGPYSEGLVEAATSADVDVLIGYPYLYHPVIDSLLHSPAKTVLIPAAHNEWMLRIPVLEELFSKVDGLVFQTDSERILTNRLFHVQQQRQLRLGLGIEPQFPDSEIIDRTLQKYGLTHNNYLMYLGRIDNGKGVDFLINLFSQYKAMRNSNLKLALVGPILNEVKNSDDVIVVGPVSDEEKWSLLHGARVFTSASRWESFGLVVLEAWAAGIPVLLNRQCDAFAELVVRSQGGLLFEDFVDFDASLHRLESVLTFGQILADNGKRFLGGHYQWEKLIEAFRAFLADLAG